MSKAADSNDQEWEVVDSPQQSWSESAENGIIRPFSISINITVNSCDRHANQRCSKTIGSSSNAKHSQATDPFPTKIEMQPQSTFLSLPAEIRLSIYSLVFKVDQPSVKMIDTRSPGHHRLSLLEACRQIYHEAGTTYFEVNVLRVSTKNLDLLRELNEARRNVIVELVLEVINGNDLFFILCRMPQLANLRCLGITWDSHYQFYNVSNWRLMRPQIKTELSKLPSLKKLYIVEDFGDRESLMLGLGNAPERTKEILDSLIQSLEDRQ